MQKHNLLEGES